MRIVYIVKYIAQLGGLDRVLAFKMNWLAVHGYEVTLITYEQTDHPFSFPLDPAIKHVEVNVKLWKKTGSNLLTRSWSYLRLRRLLRSRLTAAVASANPDVLITLTDSYQVMDVLQSIPTHARRIIESHVERRGFMKEGDFNGRPWLQRLARLYDWWQVRFIRRADALVVLTRQDATQWPEVPRVVVITNPLTFWPEETATLKAKAVIAAGRLEPQKGFDLLVEAWKDVHAVAPDWQLNIFGDGSGRERLQQQINESGLASCVHLHPATSDIVKRYAEHSCFVLSSRYEGYGLVLAEAMSCGVPCVSFDCPYGPADIIRTGEDGILVENGNVKALAEGILTYINQPVLRKAHGAKARINIQRFAPENIMARWEELFKA